jgi:DNA-binding beta-propeller fold protein YncE
MYNKESQGHVAAIDLLTNSVVWDKVVHTPGVDRGNVTPNGSSLYVPTWENDPNAPYELVLDAATGSEKARIALPARSHDTIVSLDGKRVFMETKSPTGAMYIADTTSNTITETISGYCCSKVLAPFSINGSGTTMVNDVNGFSGFQIADVTHGRIIETVANVGTAGGDGHGIAWTPNERQVWVDDGANAVVHVFDMTAPSPKQVSVIHTSNPPHWLTFSIDGKFAYIAGRKGAGDPTDVIDPATLTRVGELGPSEDLLEVDFQQGSVVAVGNQFGVGRVAG